MRNLVCLAAATLVFIVGCSSPPAAKLEPQGKPEVNNGPAGTTNGSSPSPSSVPADLKHDAFVYNGFDRVKGLRYLFSRVQGEKSDEGTQNSELKGVTNGEATYSVQRAGSLEQIGNEELLVKKDGVYLVSTSLGSPKAPVMVMPAKLSPGTVWDYDYSLKTAAGGNTTFKGKARAEKVEKIKVAAGEFDALMVSETAEMVSSGNKGTVSSKTWYAKDVGVVKMKMEVKDMTGKIVTSTIELSGMEG